mgnify:CR=1 FL=1
MTYVLVINNEQMGHGDLELGQKLMGACLKKFWSKPHLPKAICFYNSGVRLLSSKSTVLDVLDGLEQAGVEILACGTCLDYYDLKEDLRVGHVSNMDEIVNYIIAAEKVITL